MTNNFKSVVADILPRAVVDALPPQRRLAGYVGWIPVTLFPLSEVEETWNIFRPWGRAIYEEYDQSAWSIDWDVRIKRHWCHKLWPVIAGDDVYNAYYLCDLDPGPSGVFGQIIYGNMETGQMQWVANDIVQFISGLSPASSGEPTP